MEKRAWPLRIVTAVWHGLDRLRRLLHLILLLFIFLLLIVARGRGSRGRAELSGARDRAARATSSISCRAIR